MSLADKVYVEDLIFWEDFVFKYIEKTSKNEDREFTHLEARKVWDSYIFLKLKCPSLDLTEPISKIEEKLARAEEAYEKEQAML